MHDKPGVTLFQLPTSIEDIEAFLTEKLSDGWKFLGFIDFVAGKFVALAQGY